MRYIVLDLEATCGIDKETGHVIRQGEIIEIGAVIYEGREEVGRFSEFVRPVKDPKLTGFCKHLTSIKQSDVDKADTFPEVWQRFYDQWLKDHDYIILSWGDYDRKQFVHDCVSHEMNPSWVQGKYHLSLKTAYSMIYKTKRRYGMKKALEREELELDGTHHRGIDDAINTGKIFLKKFDQFIELINKHIEHESTI